LPGAMVRAEVNRLPVHFPRDRCPGRVNVHAAHRVAYRGRCFLMIHVSVRIGVERRHAVVRAEVVVPAVVGPHSDGVLLSDLHATYRVFHFSHCQSPCSVRQANNITVTIVPVSFPRGWSHLTCSYPRETAYVWAAIKQAVWPGGPATDYRPKLYPHLFVGQVGGGDSGKALLMPSMTGTESAAGQVVPPPTCRLMAGRQVGPSLGGAQAWCHRQA